ncbi:MAG: hypothetical protein Q8R08_04455 [bacterium]|nr:hypothetical protein [bacterium]
MRFRMRAVQVLLAILLIYGIAELIQISRSTSRPEIIDYWIPMAVCGWIFLAVTLQVAKQVVLTRDPMWHIIIPACFLALQIFGHPVAVSIVHRAQFGRYHVACDPGAVALGRPHQPGVFAAAK